MMLSIFSHAHGPVEPFLNWVVFLLLSCEGYAFWIQVYYQLWFVNALSHSVGYLFTFLTVLWCTKGFNFDKVQFVLLVLYLRNYCQGHEDLFLFSSRSVIVLLCLGLWSILSQFLCEEGVQLHSFACGYRVVPAPFEKTIVSPLNCLGTLVEINCPWMYGFISGS